MCDVLNTRFRVKSHARYASYDFPPATLDFRLSLIAFAFLLFLGLGLGGCNLQGFQPTPTATPELPSVEFIFPTNESTIVEGTELDVDIVGRDALTGISKIEFFVEGQKINEAVPTESSAVPVFRVTMNWRARGIGYHALSAIAYRPDGTASVEAIIIVEVVSPPSGQ
jgi:hypothetical protein